MAPLPARYVVVLVCFFAAFTCYMDRVGFPLAYTVMAKKAGIDKEVQGRIHSAFYNGYTATQIPGGWAAAKYGGERVLCTSFILWASASLLMPGDGTRTRTIFAVRVLVGASMGVVFPAIHSTLVQWIPPHERSRAVSLFTSGMYFGSAFAMLVLPIVLSSHSPRAVPIVVGGMGWAWLVLWRAVTPKLPGGTGATGPLGNTLLPVSSAVVRKSGRVDVPWGPLLRCVPLWAIVVNNFTFHYAFFILMSWLPTFYDAHGAGPSSLGWLKMLPYLIMGICSNVGGVTADLLIRKKWGVTRVRKLLNSAGFAAASVALMLLPSTPTLGASVALSSMALGSLAIARGGYSVNHMDIAPRHAGVLMGFSNGAGSMAGMIGPWVTGRILQHAPGQEGWTFACAVPAGLCTAGAMVFAAFGTGERLFD